MFLKQTFIVILLLLSVLRLYFWTLEYLAEYHPRPVTIQLLQSADKSETIEPFVGVIRRSLMRIFGERETRQALDITKDITKQVAVQAEYTFIFACILLFLLFLALNILIYSKRWTYYVVGPQDDMESILRRYLMVESALLRANPDLLKLHQGMTPVVLPVGYRLRVRDRHFAEQDYLDQLRTVLHFKSTHFTHDRYML